MTKTKKEAPTSAENIPESKPNYYVNNKEFYQEIIQFREDNRERVARGERPIIPNSIGKKILDICTHLAFRYNFINYHFRDDMISDGVTTCITYIWNFDPDKSTTPFSYFTKIAFQAFVKKIKKEKKDLTGKIAYIEHVKINEYDIVIENHDADVIGQHQDLFENFGED